MHFMNKKIYKKKRKRGKEKGEGTIKVDGME